MSDSIGPPPNTNPDDDFEEVPSTDLIFEPDIKYTPGVYAFTLNPSDEHQFKDKPGRLALFHAWISSELEYLSQVGTDYTVWIELSEPMDNDNDRAFPRLHVHGFLRFINEKAVLHWLLYGFSRFARHHHVCVKSLTTFDDWVKYCTKQSSIIDVKPISSIPDYTSYKEFVKDTAVKVESGTMRRNGRKQVERSRPPPQFWDPPVVLKKRYVKKKNYF